MLDNAKYHARTNKIRTSGNGQCEVLGRNREVLKFSKGLSAPRPMWNIFTLCCWKHYWRWELEVRAGRIRMQNAAVVLDLYFWTSRVMFNINFQFVLLVESSCNKNTFVNSIIHSVLKNNNSKRDKEVKKGLLSNSYSDFNMEQSYKLHKFTWEITAASMNSCIVLLDTDAAVPVLSKAVKGLLSAISIYLHYLHYKHSKWYAHHTAMRYNTSFLFVRRY